MAIDFTVQLPPTTDGLETDYDRQMMRWIDEAILEGDAILRDEPMYPEMDRNIAYVMGDQIDPKRSKELSRIEDNMLKDITLKTVAGLTDIHPLFGFKTFNSEFQAQGEVLDKLTRAWWTGNFADLSLADVIRYAAVLGTGYAEVSWKQETAGGAGDIVLIPRDPRDVLPIRPTLSRSIQDWHGVILRSSKSINEIKQRFGEKAKDIRVDRGGTILDRTWSRAKRFAWPLMGAGVTDIRPAPRDAVARVPSVDVVQIYVKDYSTLEGKNPQLMGEPGTSWSYWVYPKGFIKPDQTEATEKDSRLYPRGRLIIAVPGQKVLYDGPNPYWHGLFPVIRLQLDPWPWTLLGGSLVKDLRSLQDAINEAINGIFDNVKKSLRPGVVADKKSVPESLWQKIDTRLPGLKIKQNPLAGKGLEFTDPPQLPAYVFQTLELMIAEMDKKAGTANLEALAQLAQAPASDSVEAMQEAMSPILRLKGRLLEGSLRELGEMVKANFFQFYNLPRRMQYLGEDGITFNDFDFDPGSLIPAMSKSDPGYMPEYDASLDRSERARLHVKNFTFQITPNSLLSISQLSRKMTYLQLSRMGLIDRWTLYEVLEIPNGGKPPDGATTITERLMAEAMMGLQMPVGPASGRKASGQQPPQLEQKPDQNGIPRQTVSESGG